MCGIVGIATGYGRDLGIDDGAFARMRDRLDHRGPDDAGLWRHEHVALGHRRLSILDPAHGQQPMVLPGSDGAPEMVIVYNGETYNHRDLRRQLQTLGRSMQTTCDTETILHAFASWGIETSLRRMRGMFALAVYEPRRRVLTLARDPLGIKPLYYAGLESPTGPQFVFASEPGAILEHPSMPVRPDWGTVSAYLTTIRTTLDDRSLFEGIRVLRPGEMLVVDLNGDQPTGERRQWYDDTRRHDAVTGADYDDLVMKAREVVETSVRAHLLSDVPTCTLLSGGLDSTITSALACSVNPALRTYCAGGEDGTETDLDHALRAAETLGTAHTSVMVDQGRFIESWAELVTRLDRPLSTPNEVAINALACVIADHAKVALSGEGADELFAGYEVPVLRAMHHVEHPFDEAGRPVSASEHYLASNSWIPAAAKENVLLPDVLHTAQRDVALWDVVDRAFGRYAAEDGEADLRSHLEVHRHFNLTSLLGRLDTAMMLASVEGRTPLADVEVLEFARSLPISASLEMENGTADAGPGATAVASIATSKRILRDAFSHVVPGHVMDRPKASFPLPFQTWLPAAVERLDTAGVAGQVFSPAAMEMVKQDPATHWPAAWPILNVAMWLETRWGGLAG